MDHLKKHLIFYLVGLLFIVTAFIWSAVFLEVSRDKLVVSFLDVGQGDAIFIDSPNGRQILIDGGSNNKVLRELSRVMPFYDRSIDVVIATHPDKDHIGGLPEVFKRYKIDYFLEPGVIKNTGVYEALINSVSDEGIESTLARRNMEIDLGDGVVMKILFPDRNVGGVEINTASIVSKLIYGKNEFLLTGDSPKSIEKLLVSVYRENLKSDVLKAGHHGSKTSSNKLFIGFVDPDYVVISAGKDNRYGHPHQEVLDVLNSFNIEVLNTAEVGRIQFFSDGRQINLRR